MFNENTSPERQAQYDEFCRLLDKWLESFSEDAKSDVYANLNEPPPKREMGD